MSRSKPRGILVDLDGVVYDGERPISGSTEALAWVRERGIPHLFLTNTTSLPRLALVTKLTRLGVAAEESQIWTPPAAAAAWLGKQPGGTIALFVPEATRTEFANFALAPDDGGSLVDYVVIGDLGECWDFATLNRAFRLLHANPSAQLLALGMTRYWRSPAGVSLDVAPVVVALEHAADRTAVVLGKPAKLFFEEAAARLGIAPGDLLMIGDDVQADVAGAQAAGLRGALVRTGKFRPADLQGEVRPEAVLDSLAELPDWWKEG